jgi:hypothetical protein
MHGGDAQARYAEQNPAQPEQGSDVGCGAEPERRDTAAHGPGDEQHPAEVGGALDGWAASNEGNDAVVGKIAAVLEEDDGVFCREETGRYQSQRDESDDAVDSEYPDKRAVKGRKRSLRGQAGGNRWKEPEREHLSDYARVMTEFCPGSVC